MNKKTAPSKLGAFIRAGVCAELDALINEPTCADEQLGRNVEQEPCLVSSIDYSRHPITGAGYGFVTPQLESIYTLLVKRIMEKRTGLAFIAPSRHGKTTAIELVARQLAAEFPDLAIISYVAESTPVPRESSFFGSFLAFQNLQNPQKGSGSILRTRMKNYCLVRGRESISRQIVLLIDEAQRLFIEEWEWLSDILNFLKWKSIYLTVVSFGQQELQDRRDLAANISQMNLVARFFSEMHRFTGISSLSDLEVFMEQYDLERFPSRDGPTFTEFFLPKAWEGKFRLKTQAQDLWMAITSILPSANNHDYPLEHLVIAINKFLTNEAENDSIAFISTTELWKTYIDDSGLPDYLALSN